MKKIIALILSLILLCSIFAVSASAAANYCEEFNGAISMLRWWIEGNEVKQGENFPADTVLDYTLSKFDENKYATEKSPEGYALKIEIPATEFEGKAKELFAKLDVAELRAVQVYDGYDYDNNKVIYRQCYDEAKNVYVFDGAGGMGDSSHYCVYGYTGTSKYTVYSAFVQGEEPLDSAPADKIEGKDYIREGDNFYIVYHWLKTVVEKGDEVKFHSWEKVASIPDVSLVRNEKTLEKKPEATSSQVTSSAQETSSQATSSTVEISSQANSTEAETSSQAEERYEIVTKTDEIVIQAVKEAFPEGTTVKIIAVTEGKVFKTAKKAMDKKATKFVAYDITAIKDNAAVQPDGTVKAEFAIPTDYDYNKVCVVYIDDKGAVETMPCVVDKKASTVTATLSHFSVYAVAEMINMDSLTTGAKAQTAPIVWVLIFIAIVVVLCGGFAAWYFLYFKKKGVNIAE